MWSWVLCAIGVASMYFIGSGRREAWLVGAATQVAWIVYALATLQYGFVVSALAYGAVYIRNWRRAGKKPE